MLYAALLLLSFATFVAQKHAAWLLRFFPQDDAYPPQLVSDSSRNQCFRPKKIRFLDALPANGTGLSSHVLRYDQLDDHLFTLQQRSLATCEDGRENEETRDSLYITKTTRQYGGHKVLLNVLLSSASRTDHFLRHGSFNKEGPQFLVQILYRKSFPSVPVCQVIV